MNDYKAPSFTKYIIIIMMLLFIVYFVIFYKTSQEIEKSGGIGFLIGKEVGNFQRGMQEGYSENN